MEIDCDISRLCLTLQEFSALKVVEQLLYASDIASVRTGKSKTVIVSEAEEAAKTLEMPNSMKELIQSLILPVSDELAYWYLALHMPGKPILTQQGTLDMISSAKDVLDDIKVDRCTRFLVACVVCNEKHIYELGKQLTPKERVKIQTLEAQSLGPSDKWCRYQKLANCWLDAYNDRVVEKFDGEDLPQTVYHKMLKIAMKTGDDIILRFFFKKAKLHGMVRESIESLPMTLPTRLELNFSPATVYDMISTVTQNERSAAIVASSGLLLVSLTYWPYQRFFLKVSSALIGNLTQVHFWRVLYFIIQKIVFGYQDWNYQEMFITFFRSGAVQRRNLSFANSDCLQLATFIFISQDDLIVQFFLSQISEHDKIEFLLGFDINKICAHYLNRSQYKRLEMFIRGCAMRRKDLLVQFKNEYLSVYRKCQERTCFYGIDPELSDRTWAARLQKLAEIVDKIISEECIEDAVA